MNPYQPAPKKTGKMHFWLKMLAWALGIFVVGSVIVSQKLKSYVSNIGGQEVAVTKAKMRTISFMLSSQKLFNLRYPSQEEGLEKMMGASGSAEEDLKVSERLNDGWKRRFRYRFPGKHRPESYDLYSLGADGIEDTEDDVTNWETETPPEAQDSPLEEKKLDQDLPK